MPKPLSEIRTFIQLGSRELAFLRALRQLIRKKTGRKRVPPLHQVIQGVLLDYRRVLEVGANPELLSAYEEVVRRRTRRPSAIVDPTGVPRAGPTARP
jgi:hypothetical protein